MNKSDRELLKQYATRFLVRRGNIAYWQVTPTNTEEYCRLGIVNGQTRTVAIHAMANAVSAIKQALKDAAQGKPSVKL